MGHTPIATPMRGMSSLDGPPPLPEPRRAPSVQGMAGEQAPQPQATPAALGDAGIRVIMEKHMRIDQALRELADILPDFAPTVDEIGARMKQGIARALQAQTAQRPSPQDSIMQSLGQLGGGGRRV